MVQVDANVTFDNSDEASQLLQVLGQLQNAGDNLQEQAELLEEQGYKVEYSQDGGELKIKISEA
jgi:hypothetical protein